MWTAMERRRVISTGAMLLLVVVLLLPAAMAAAGPGDVGGGGGSRGEEEEDREDERFMKLWTDHVHGGGGGDEGDDDYLSWAAADEDEDDEVDVEEAVAEGENAAMLRETTGCARPAPARRNVVSVNSFGAAGDGCTDDTEAFMAAWKKACSVKDAVFVVPRGRRYKVGASRFMGPCKDERMTVLIQGTIVAPEEPSEWDPKSPRLWLLFGGLVGARIQGGGVIDGSGSRWWANSCKIDKSKPCKAAPTAVTIDSCRGVRVKGLRIQNAQQMHLTVSRCRGVRVAGVSIEAPGDSPNTDGIHVAESTAVTITGCRIGTGDDCISISNASFVVKMKGIVCDPGHGISIGSLGQGGSYAAVEGVTLDDARISRAQNGVRIKTWQGGSGYVRGVRFSNVLVDGVDHPIVIDQFYCDSRTPCRNQTSNVRVSDVAYRNISGTSTRAEAIRFACSDAVACRDIVLSNINLLREDGGAEVQTVCNCAMGKNYGPVRPAADCLMNSVCGGSGGGGYGGGGGGGGYGGAGVAEEEPAAMAQLHTEL